MMSEIKQYFFHYLSIKNHFKRKDFLYGKNGISLKYVKKHQYDFITKYAKTMTLKTFKKYLMINFFFNDKFNIYSKEIIKVYFDAYYIYYSNKDYYYKRDVKIIKEYCDKFSLKINYEMLYNLYIKKEIFYFTIIELYKIYKGKLEIEKEIKEKLDKYIYLENKIK